MPASIVNPKLQKPLVAVFSALTLFMALIVALARPVQAQAQQPPTGLDLVFVIDQSGSMGGQLYDSTDHPLPNDPNDLRFEGLQQMVDRLGSYHLYYYSDSSIQYQIAVVYFGSTTEIIVPATIIDPATADQWEPLRLRLTNDLSADAFTRNLGNTNHIAALQQAKNILQQMEGAWQGGRHTQAIFMLTDGEWYLGCPQPAIDATGTPQPIANEPEYCRNGEFQYNIYRNLLDAYVQAEIWPENYEFYLGAINDRDPQKETWSRVRTWWEKWTRGNAELLDRNLMWVFFEQVLAEITVEEIPPERGIVTEIPITQTQLCLNPYLQEVTIIIHKPEPSQRVLFYQEDGQLVDDLVRTTVRDADKFIEQIIVREPEPGCITIERPTSDGIHRIFVLTLDADVSCALLSASPQYLPLQLRCTITGRTGKLPPYKDPKYALEVVASINGPGGSAERVPLDSPQIDGIYTGFFLPAQTGVYEYNLLGSTHSYTGESIQFFGWPEDGTPARFTVEPTTPRLQSASPPTALVPTTVNVGLVDAGGAPVPIPADTSRYVHMQVSLAPDKVGQPVELGAGASGYEGAFVVTEAGAYEVRLTGEVENPATGQRVRAFDESLGQMSVLPPRPVWQGFANPWPQYREAIVDFQLMDNTGNIFADVVDSKWQLVAEAKIDGGAQETVVPLSIAGPSRWQGQYTPQNAGDFNVSVSVWADDQAGTRVALLQDQIIFPFAVQPMTLVQKQIVAPQQNAEHPWRDMFWRPQPVAIEVALVDDANNPIAPAKALRNAAAMPFVVNVIAPDGKQIGPLSLRQGEALGRYLTTFEDYNPYVWYAHRDLGWYEIQLHTPAELKETFIYQTDDDVTARVHLVRHPLWWLAPLLAAILLLFILTYLLYQSYLRLWTARGVLRNDQGGIIAYLHDAGKHTVVFRHNLGSDITKVRVHHPLGQKNRVNLTVWKRRGPKLGPRLSTSLGGVTYDPQHSAAPTVVFTVPLLIFGILSLIALAGLLSVGFVVLSSLT